MSANNALLIMKCGNKFCVYENLCVDNKFEPSKESLLKSFLTLPEAIKYVNEYCQEYLVEYGYSIDNNCLEKSQSYRIKK